MYSFLLLIHRNRLGANGLGVSGAAVAGELCQTLALQRRWGEAVRKGGVWKESKRHLP